LKDEIFAEHGVLGTRSLSLHVEYFVATVLAGRRAARRTTYCSRGYLDVSRGATEVATDGRAGGQERPRDDA